MYNVLQQTVIELRNEAIRMRYLETFLAHCECQKVIYAIYLVGLFIWLLRKYNDQRASHFV
jgi:hypothetical protein